MHPNVKESAVFYTRQVLNLAKGLIEADSASQIGQESAPEALVAQAKAREGQISGDCLLHSAGT